MCIYKEVSTSVFLCTNKNQVNAIFGLVENDDKDVERAAIVERKISLGESKKIELKNLSTFFTVRFIGLGDLYEFKGWESIKPRFSKRVEKERAWARLYPGIPLPDVDENASEKIGKAIGSVIKRVNDLTRVIDRTLKEEGI